MLKLVRTDGLIPWVGDSYRHDESFELILGYRQSAIFKGRNVEFDSFSDIGDSGLFRFPLAYATREAGTFNNPDAVFPWIDTTCLIGIPLQIKEIANGAAEAGKNLAAV